MPEELDDEELALLKKHREDRAKKRGHRARVWPDGSAEVELDDDAFGKLVKRLGLADDDDQSDDDGKGDDKGDDGGKKKAGRGWFD